MPDRFHESVLVQETANILVTDTRGIYMDCTVGGGGHSLAIIGIAPEAQIIGVDRDADAIEESRRRLPTTARLYRMKFGQISEWASELSGRVSGVLFDLGISSHELRPERGFSYRLDGPLDMRMDPSSGMTAAQLLAGTSEAELVDLLWEYGEESQSRRIARAIMKNRREMPITTTLQLARIVTNAVPATCNKSLARVFQALRIVVNDEMNELTAALPAAFGFLREGGRMAVISYHSLEDRVVKRFVKERVGGGQFERLSPFSHYVEPDALELTKKPIVPSQEEVKRNPRSRSAKLRALERIRKQPR